MFDIGFWELILISILGLVVLGPERLPVAIRSVMRFVNSAKSMANNVKEELDHELKIQELQENLRKAEKMGMEELAPDLKQSVEELKQAAQSVQQPYKKDDASKGSEPVSSPAEAPKAKSSDTAS
ncbi:twin-arginine translocation protein tatB [Vibrio sp. JCM 19236]|nr:twin-arginine translocation protein tatB [Vibrio sp. JCM 19236]